MGGLDELPPLDLVVLGPHVGIARREPLHLPGKVGALELEQRPVEFSPPGGVHRHRAQAEERCAALQKRFAVGMRIPRRNDKAHLAVGSWCRRAVRKGDQTVPV